MKKFISICLVLILASTTLWAVSNHIVLRTNNLGESSIAWKQSPVQLLPEGKHRQTSTDNERN